jgi:type III secretion protein J
VRAALASVAALASLAALTACNAPVATGLDEADANRIVIALDRASIDCTKEVDPSADSKFRVLVAKDDTARALGAMKDDDLPRARPAGVLDVGKGSLIPSQAAEHAQLVAGIAGDMQRSLEAIDGVIAARVHLDVPEPDPLRDTRALRPTASVLLEHRGSTPPLASESVQRLIAGGVAGMLPNDVAVVTVSRVASAQSSRSGAGQTGASYNFAHVGPIAVARSSMRTLQAGLAALIALIALLAAATLLLYTRLTRTRAELHARAPSSPSLAPRS